MTLARTERGEDFSAALKTMLDSIRDAALDEVPFAPSAHPDILNTPVQDPYERPGCVEEIAQLDRVSSPITRRSYARRETRIDPMQALRLE
jgi:hypothetical protein